MEHPVSEMLGNSMEKIRQMVDVNTIVGNPINTAQGVTLIPVSKISYGYAGGGTDFVPKNPAKDNPFGGGSGCAVKITPVAFLVIKGENVRMIPVTEAPSSSLDRVIEMVPELVDKLSEFISEQKAEKKAKETPAE